MTHSVPTRRASDLNACRHCAPATGGTGAGDGREAGACWNGPADRRTGGKACKQLDLAEPLLRAGDGGADRTPRSEEHTSELQSLMRSSYAVFCLTKKKLNKLQYQ